METRIMKKQMTNCRKRRAGLLAAATTMAMSMQVMAEPDLTNLIDILDETPEGSWVKVNVNLMPAVWTPSALRPLITGRNPEPKGIIGAWSSYAWDPNRGDLWIFGGGHANYSGNDVYRWRGSTRMWERASLPSEVKQDDMGNWTAIDGPFAAPASAHTYDNNVFLPIVDRMLTLGGAAFNNGSVWEMATSTTTERRTGPYLFDPNKADGNKVGGTTGSHVKRVAPYPDILGGGMWENRDIYSNPALTGLPKYYVNGCTAYAEEAGKDVVYIGANTGGGTSLDLHKYTINDINNRNADTWQRVGSWHNGSSGQIACAYDPETKVFLRTNNDTTPLVYWNVTTPSINNLNVLVQPVDPTGEFPTLLAQTGDMMRMCGLDFDSVRRKFALWCGDGRVWMISAPPSVSPVGWTVVKQPAPTGVVPVNTSTTGILGKWKYIPNLEAFMGLQGASEGNVWLYKPVGWTRPGGGTVNIRPTVSITEPSGGAVFNVGDPIVISANAADEDGFVTKVEFLDRGIPIGEDTDGEPYTFTWTGATAGPHELTAVATDNSNAKRTSSAVPLSVVGAGGSISLVLQDGLDGYTGASDVNLSSYHQTRTTGAATQFLDQSFAYTTIVKFAIFNSEGGPVPDGATIDSARFSIYKANVYNMEYGLHRMQQSWSEDTATWLQRSPGQPWGAAGATLAGVDYTAIPDAEDSVDWAAGWVEFDVTTAVRAFRSGSPNHGWRLRGKSGSPAALKYFNASEFLTNPSLRPKLEISYTVN